MSLRVNIEIPRDNFAVKYSENFESGITGIYGPSGSGKTTLLQCISGLEIPSSGHIYIENKALFDSVHNINLPIHKRNIGYVFQEGRLFPHLNIEQNLKFGFKKHNPDYSFYDIINMLEITHLIKKYPHEISGGERQRVAIGRALLSSPDLLLFDEPFSAVDTNLRSQIIPYILKIHNSTQIQMLVVSHDLPDILRLTDTILMVHKGTVLVHDEYHNIIRNHKIHSLYQTNTLLNVIEMEVFAIYENYGLTILHQPKLKNDIKIICERIKKMYSVGEQIKIFISPEDIAISKLQLSEVTIQNQLPGKITDLIKRGNRMLCIVDVGFPLMVDITYASLIRLGIEIGSDVWCMFKSLAIDVAG